MSSVAEPTQNQAARPPRPAKQRRSSHGRSTRRWHRIVTELRSRRLPCWLCGHLIDYSLPPNHRDSFTVHHRVPLAVAPHLAEDPTNLAPAHRSCNSRQGDNPEPPPLATSRRW